MGNAAPGALPLQPLLAAPAQLLALLWQRGRSLRGQRKQSRCRSVSSSSSGPATGFVQDHLSKGLAAQLLALSSGTDSQIPRLPLLLATATLGISPPNPEGLGTPGCMESTGKNPDLQLTAISSFVEGQKTTRMTSCCWGRCEQHRWLPCTMDAETTQSYLSPKSSKFSLPLEEEGSPFPHQPLQQALGLI